MKKNSLLIVVVITLLISLFIFSLVIRSQTYVNTRAADIASFTDCQAAGYDILESSPRQCKTPDGRTFIEVIDTSSSVISEPSNIVILKPEPNEVIQSPFYIRGQARIFENEVSYRLKTLTGDVVIEGTVSVVAPEEGTYGAFDKRITYERPEGDTGILELFSSSPDDGSEINTVVVPVRFR